MSLRTLAFAAFSAAAAAAALPAHATITIGSAAATYNQSFDSLTQNGTSTAWVNDSTLDGWSLFNSLGNAITTYLGGTGSSSSGSFYSFGASGNSDRALGGLGSGGTYFGSPASGAVAGWIALALTNTSATAFDSFTLAFNGEQWRNGGNTSAQTMALQYGFGNSFAGVASWVTPGSGFNWSSPVVGSTAGTVNGNAAGLVSGLGGTVITTWTPGQTLWLRWVENNDNGNDHALAIDNFALSVTAPVPEPTSGALLVAGLIAIGTLARRRLR